MKNLLFKNSFVFGFIFIAMQVAGQEICDNGIDDDSDGMIDCFDSDCIGIVECEEFYFNQPVPVCSDRPPVLNSYYLKLKYKTDSLNYPIDQRCGVFVGDMNGDLIPDLIGKRPEQWVEDGTPVNVGGINYPNGTTGIGRIYIFKGITGELLQGFETVGINNAFSQVAIADVDADGNGDIFVVEINTGRTGTDYRLKRYEYNPALADGSINSAAATATSASGTLVHFQQTPQIADFNQDGIPEVYVGNQIFHSTDASLKRLVNGGTAHSGKLGVNNDSYPLAYDVFSNDDIVPGTSSKFSDLYGSKADGLELICGNKIYLVDFDPAAAADNGTLTEAAYIPMTGLMNGDGYVSIADLNKDDRIDVVVTSTDGTFACIYAWDPYTENQIGSTYFFPAGDEAGRVNIGDFDNDGDLEMGTAGYNIYVVLEYNRLAETFDLKWSKITDDGSSMTGSTLFDFEGDGSVEVVYSDEENLFIWKGNDGAELSKIVSQSGTRTDYPLVADADADGQAEIIISAQGYNGPDSYVYGYISVYRSADAPWVAARETWNQHGYFVTNVNNDNSLAL